MREKIKQNYMKNKKRSLKIKKGKEEKKMIRRIVLLPDIHYPKHNKPAIEAVFQFVKWFKPHAEKE